MPDKFDKAWKGPEQRHSEGDIDYLYRRMAWLEGKVRDMEELIHFVGDGLEEHSGTYAHGGSMMGNPIASMRFFMVPWSEETETVLRDIIEYQREAIRNNYLLKWLKELPSEIDQDALGDVIDGKLRYFEDSLEEYVNVCVSRALLERRLNIRAEERKPLVDHLDHVEKITIFSVQRTKDGMRVIPHIKDGLEHRYGVPLRSNELRYIIRGVLTTKADDHPIPYKEVGDGRVLFQLKEHLI